MATRAVDMFEVRIPLKSVKRLSDEERYSYYLLGHIFNELMCLQKIVGFALPKHDDQRPARLRPELAQAMFLFRLACGKIWEASQIMRKSKQLSATLVQVILPRMPDGLQRLKALNASINGAPWLSPMRNGLGFHFPSYDDWKGHVTPDSTWVDDQLFMGNQSGNTFYDAADSIAQGWMFGQYGLADPRAAVDPLISQMIELLREMNTFLEEVLGVFVGEILLGGRGERKHVGKVLSPLHEAVSVPFWTVMPPRAES